jgi:hypothetical protein
MPYHAGSARERMALQLLLPRPFNRGRLLKTARCAALEIAIARSIAISGASDPVILLDPRLRESLL